MSDLSTIDEVQTLVAAAQAELAEIQAAIIQTEAALIDSQNSKAAEDNYVRLQARLIGAKGRLQPLQADLRAKMALPQVEQEWSQYKAACAQNGAVNSAIEALQADQKACYAAIAALDAQIDGLDKRNVLDRATDLHVLMLSNYPDRVVEINAIWKAQ